MIFQSDLFAQSGSWVIPGWVVLPGTPWRWGSAGIQAHGRAGHWNIPNSLQQQRMAPSLLGSSRNPAPLGVLCLPAWQRNWNFTSGAAFVLVPDKDTRGALKTVFQMQVGEDESPRCVIPSLHSLSSARGSIVAGCLHLCESTDPGNLYSA